MTANGTEETNGAGAFERRLLLAVDAKGYGRADAVTQREFQEGIMRLLGRAAATSRLDRAGWVTQQGGDSVFAVLPEKAYEPDLIDTFMRALDAGLRAFNGNRVAQARLRLRAAVHFGPASLGANGFVGRAPVETGRILDCAALRRALDVAPDACLAVAVSATVFDDVVGAAYTSIPADQFRQVQVEEKEYRGRASIWVPGVDVWQLDLEPVRQVTAPGTAGPGTGEVGRGAEQAPRPSEGPAVPMNESGGPLVQIDVEAKEVAGTATLVRTDRPEGTIKGTAKIDRLDGTFVGADIRTTGDEK
ncbi:hypothetical protein [Streptomyces sp. NBC_00576]|uniref:hypothetical protein n=1 Tax=Streptomyces sp. NBC_00576 TaxID=2903665 RepID=UPI002E822C9B|nr:hypothetical protein [Streptomyces sp. NBC_00576]WUB73491.1 hypothetical protein OG734_27325 [Streptomyces sp. NBC_00576]